jgi:hypothetical protein
MKTLNFAKKKIKTLLSAVVCAASQQRGLQHALRMAELSNMLKNDKAVTNLSTIN